MGVKLSARQRAYIKKHGTVHEPGVDELDDELNIVPFLDIVINLIMFLLMTIATAAFFNQLEAAMPPSGPGAPGSNDGERPLNLHVVVSQRGVIVTTSNGKLDTGCTGTASGDVISVPRVANGYDWPALTQCLARVKAAGNEEERRVTITGDPQVEYQEIIHAMDAARVNGEDELFPEIRISAGVR